ncbi:RmlC-like cupin domain-containing protein [Lasiosphaeria miniovina]|uniref:RmlC-like cupin domain-containing protein n=1 Tax=Lasiosphaeria miniovina TaxID=1954250 RepID=A0AA40ACN6_9PEZI|nr:RmlC-like cupin domain-containing protein [Lasiosphaeria miniovina]KAK0713423.1 RmlC-like cupin domain-containing protein [Lasiosphaeria miniovina]
MVAELHEKDPDNFTDPNHKPEIAVALTKFEVLAGFKPLSEIQPLFKLPILKLFTPRKDFGEAAHIADLLPRLRDQYGPRDSGTLVVPTCMNFMVLAPSNGPAVLIATKGKGTMEADG